MKKKIFVLLAVLLGSIYVNAVTFNVQVPDGTQKCFVCGDFNGWNADEAYEMTSIGNNLFTLNLPEVTSVSRGYKYLCGRSWDFVEKAANGDEIDNRTAIGNPDIVGSWRGVPEYGIESFEVVLNGLPRLVKVYLPAGYDESSETYPVIYYNSVQQRYSNAGDDGNPGDYFFGPNSWNAHSHMETLRENEGSAYIMVQVCSHMGENTVESHPEYAGTGNASLYLTEFVNQLIPEINKRFRTDKDKKSIIVGADYGALFSLYAAITRPDIFETSVAMSPMLWINSDAMSSIASGVDATQKFYVTVGALEPEWMKADANRFATALREAGATSYYSEFAGARHNDGSWGAIFPVILKSIVKDEAPETGNDGEDETDFSERQFALYSASNIDYWATTYKGAFSYTTEYYDTTEAQEAFVFAQEIDAKYTANYYWNVSNGPDNTDGWLFDSPKSIGFSTKRTTAAWQRVAVLKDGTVKDLAAVYNGFNVKTGAGSTVKMTSLDNFKAQATVSFPTDNKTFHINYGSVNSGSDMGALTPDYAVSADCTEALIVFDFVLNKVTVQNTGQGETVEPEPETPFKERVYTLYASDVIDKLQKIGTFTYTDEYYKKGSSEAIPAFIFTHDVSETYKGKYYWNIATGASDSDGWFFASPKDIGFSSSHNTVSWLNIAVYEDGTSDNIAAHSQGFRVVNGSNNTVMMTSVGNHISKATVKFETSDKTFTVHFGSVNSSSDQGSVTPVVSVSDNCLEAEITYDFNLNKVSVTETRHGQLSEQPSVVSMQAFPAVANAGDNVDVKFALNKASNVTVKATYNFNTSVNVTPVKNSEKEYTVTLPEAKEGTYTLTVSLTDGSTSVADAGTINIKVLAAKAEKSKRILTVNAYKGVNWETTNRYKANFHTHTSQSFDTQYSTTTVVDRYKNAGYKILALTDHDANSYPWTMFDLYNSEAEPRDPSAMGMLAIPGNELSKDRRNNWSESTGGEFNHHNDFFTGRKGQEFMSLRESYAYTEALGGMQIINHPGQYWNLSTEYSAGAKNSPEWHADNFTRYSSLVGLEVYNQGNRRPNDRILWDQILTLTMPKRPVWGYSCDDTHSSDQYFRNYQFMLMPELSVNALKQAMTDGATVFSYEYTGSGNDKAPHIDAIDVDETANTITITTNDADRIEWIYSTHRTGSSASTTQSTVVGLGNTFSYDNYQGTYVRARLINQYGETATQPFGFELSETVSADDVTLAAKDDALSVNHDREGHILTVTCSEPMERLTVIDASGRIVRYAECSLQNTCTLSTNNLTPGVYIVIVATPTAAYTAKFM